MESKIQINLKPTWLGALSWPLPLLLAMAASTDDELKAGEANEALVWARKQCCLSPKILLTWYTLTPWKTSNDPWGQLT